MAIHDEISQRLYVSDPLSLGSEIACSRSQANYLLNVLRLSRGAIVRVFNGFDGEWQAALHLPRRKDARLIAQQQVRPQTVAPDIDYLFAPLKHARLDYMVQKATEMGARRLRPVITRRTIAQRVNLDRMRANTIEAAEQCGLLAIPDVFEPVELMAALDTWDAARRLVFCDEGASHSSPLAQLQAVPIGPVAVLIGPEGGFDPTERAHLLALAYTLPISLGPRIMRADTAAVAALALVNATIGNDW